MLKLFVVEDHALVREGLMLALQALAGDGEPAEIRGAASADEALALLGDDADIDLILLDVMLPGTGGLALLGALRKRHPAVPVLMLSALDDAATVRRAMRQGAAGFVPKAVSTDTLLGAVREVLAGGRYLPPQFADAAAQPARGNIQTRFRLTAAQMRVLELLVEGKTNREIAAVIGVAEGTVKIHVSAIFKALDVSNRSQALLVAGRHGLKAR
jgi:DNA-binding NarL/FixJ family response regulator